MRAAELLRAASARRRKLHEVVVDGRRGGLDQVDIVPPDALQ
jgi:hypothetical protein